MKKPNSLVKRTKIGEELNVFLENGCVMEIQTVLMVLMKTQLCTIVLLNNLAVMTSSRVPMDDASTRVGFVITITTVGTELMKEKTVNINHAVPMNFLVATLSVSGTNTGVMERTTVVIILTRLIAVSILLIYRVLAVSVEI